jgi:predicted transcriptional regulator
MKVKEVMIRDVISFKPEDPLSYVAWSLCENSISGAPVVDYKGELEGIVTREDLLLALV